MNNSTVTILNDEFENSKTGEKVQGITIIIDGKIKQVMDVILKKNKNYTNYSEIISDAFIKGINQIITNN